MDRPWFRILTLWLLGILAAAQFAKMSIIAPILRTQLGLSLSQLGWLISLLEVGGGLFGLISGLTLARYGVRRFLLIGLVILSAMSLVEALTAAPFILFAARAIEGIGYVLVIIAAPTAIAATPDDGVRGRALALWSTFVPVGIAVGGAVTGLAVGMLGARGVMLFWAVVLAAAVPVTRRFAVADTQRSRIRFPAAAAWVSTFGFGLYTIFISVLTMLLPSFLIDRSGATVAEAAMVTALASLGALPGTAVAIWLMREKSLDRRRTVLCSTLALIATVPLVLFLYQDMTTTLPGAGTIAVLAVTISGLAPPLLFARLPTLAGATSPDDPRIATANGLITQFGAGGALVGPPLGGLIVGIWGWSALGVVTAALVVAMLVTIVAAEWIGRGSKGAGSR